MVVLASFSDRDIEENYRVGFPRGGTWIIRFNSDWKGYGSDFHEVGNPGGRIEMTEEGCDGFPYSALVQIPSYGLIILSQDVAGPAADDIEEPA